MFDVPPKLKWLEKSAAGREWLRQLSAHVQAGVDRWSLRLEPPYESSCVSITSETPDNISLSFRPMGWSGNIGICSHGAVLIGEGSRRIVAVFGRFLSNSRLRKDESNRGDSQEQRESR